jgi:hypothetical protein
MRKSIFTIFILLLSTTLTNAQVGIGTTSPNGSAQLDVTSNNKGFLPPRVALIATNAASPITSPVAGLLVYNTATAGTSPNNVTPGFYYYNGSTWVRLTTPTDNVANVTGVVAVQNGGTGVTTSTGSGSNVLSTSPILTTPNIASGSSQWANSLTITPTTHGTSQRASIWIDGWSLLQDIQGNGTKNFSIGQTVPGSPTTYPSRLVINTVGNVGIGNETPNARLDIRTSPTSTSNPGDGYMGIGTTTTAANTAGAGAIRYNTTSGGILEYSNGTNWNTLQSSVSKATVIASKGTAQTIPHNTPTDITNWNELTDNANVFDPTTGVFTAPRSGNYVFNFSYAFALSTYTNAANLNIEAWMNCSTFSKLRKQLLAAPVNIDTRCGAMISFVVNLTAGETLRPAIWHSTGATRSLEVNAGGEAFNNLSIVEL